MSDGATLKVDSSDLERKLTNMLDFTKNFKPYFQKILGQDENSPPETIKGGIHYNFENSMSPAGDAFRPLSDIYKKWKDKHFSPDLPILMRSQWLYDSLVHANSDSVLQMSNTRLVYGTKVLYAHAQFNGFAAHNLPARNALGWRKGQVAILQLQLRQYVVDAFNLKATRV